MPPSNGRNCTLSAHQVRRSLQAQQSLEKMFSLWAWASACLGTRQPRKSIFTVKLTCYFWRGLASSSYSWSSDAVAKLEGRATENTVTLFVASRAIGNGEGASCGPRGKA